jgi:flagellin
MALIINHNLAAMKTARLLGNAYDSLSKSIERLSSGLRINSAADDAAGLAVREMMRADIASNYQGIRNTADAISMIQSADGALALIDQKLIKMKQLAEQAATGTYSDIQRELINSEYQSMASEIDRIANSTVFNGVKLLDGTLSTLNNGLGMRIHFGPGNTENQDYYYIKVGDVRASSTGGLKIGGDAKNDIWSTGAYGNTPGSCCGGAIQHLDSAAVLASGQAFAYGYNWDLQASGESDLLNPKYLAGRYGLDSGATYQDIINSVNSGTQSRIMIHFASSRVTTDVKSGHTAICLGSSEMYYWGCAVTASAGMDPNADITRITSTNPLVLASAINNNQDSKFWAMVVSANGNTDRYVVVFMKEAGNNNNVKVEMEKNSSAGNAKNISFIDPTDPTVKMTGSANLVLGGQHWGTLVESPDGNGYSLALLGRDYADDRDLWIASDDSIRQNSVFTTQLSAAGVHDAYVTTLEGTKFVQVQNASDGDWNGAHLRTQEAAQQSLNAIDDAIVRKDSIRANLGAIQNLLESTLENLTIEVENLQAAESRISDVDVATEMTEFTKNNVLAQAATAMLAQANSLSNLALTLIMGY